VTFKKRGSKRREEQDREKKKGDCHNTNSEALLSSVIRRKMLFVPSVKVKDVRKMRN
jgi:hypothetical protein